MLPVYWLVGSSPPVVQDARFFAVSLHGQGPGNRKVRTSVDAWVGNAVSSPVMPSVLPTAMSGQYVIPSSRSYVPSPGSMYLLSSSSGGRVNSCPENVCRKTCVIHGVDGRIIIRAPPLSLSAPDLSAFTAVAASMVLSLQLFVSVVGRPGSHPMSRPLQLDGSSVVALCCVTVVVG